MEQLFYVFSLFSSRFGCRFAWKIDGELFGYGVKIVQKMAANDLREIRKSQISISGLSCIRTGVLKTQASQNAARMQLEASQNVCSKATKTPAIAPLCQEAHRSDKHT